MCERGGFENCVFHVFGVAAQYFKEFLFFWICFFFCKERNEVEEWGEWCPEVMADLVDKFVFLLEETIYFFCPVEYFFLELVIELFEMILCFFKFFL